MTAVPDSPAGQGTLLWIGDGGRPTYAVVDYLRQLRWPAESDRPLPWRIYSLDRREHTEWPLAAVWSRCGHVSADFLTWDFRAHMPYDTVFVDNILGWGYDTQSRDSSIDTWESPTLQGKTRQQKLAVWAERLAALEAPYILTSGTVAPDDPEDGDIIPDMTLWGYRLLASRAYERRVHTGWYIWHRQCDDASSTETRRGSRDTTATR